MKLGEKIKKLRTSKLMTQSELAGDMITRNMLSQIENDENLSKKPDAVKEKMVVGRISKFYDNNCLLFQAYVKDDSFTVGKYVESVAKEIGADLSVATFVKYEKGEGIAKREDDFAAEIEKLVKG